MSAYDLPALNIRAVFQNDGNAEASFLSAMEKISTGAKERFDQSFTEIGQIINRSLSSFKRGDFKLDLDLSGLRQAANEADFAYQRLALLRDAAIKLAQSTNDTSQSTHLYIQALRAQTTEAASARTAANEQVQTYGRLQSAVDKLVDRNQVLAQSYRDTYLEQAKAENYAYRRQQSVNAVAAPGLVSRATDNGATYSALAAMAEAEDQAALATQRHAQAAAQLRQALDPTIVIQQRFDDELARADGLLEAGAISQREYAAAVQLARQNLQESYSAIVRGSDAQEQAARRGTSATNLVVNSMRSQRIATIQAGQQLQDMAVQFQQGTRASTIFAQQIPQLGFALSYLDGNSNALLGKLGKLGTTMAGLGGVAVVLSLVALGPLIDALAGTGDAVDRETEKLRKNAEESEATRRAKELFAKTEEGVRQAILDQKDALDKQDQSLQTEAERALEAAKANLQHEISIRNTTQAMLEQAIAQERIDKQRAGAIGPRGEIAALGADVSSSRVAGLEAALAKQNDAIKIAQGNLTRTQANASVEAGARDADPLATIRRLYEGPKGLIEQARQRAIAEGKVGSELERQVAALKQQEQARIDEANAAKRGSNTQYGREIDLNQAEAIAQKAGLTITSGFRTRADQQRLYDTARTSQNPVAAPGTSAHESGNALDIAFGKGVSVASIRKAFQDEGVKLTKVLTESGHFHIEWSTTGADKVKREAEELAKFGDNAREKIARITSQFDEAPKAIDQATAATRDLDATITDLSQRKPIGWDQMVKDAEAAKQTIEDSLVRPFEDITKQSERRIQIQSLIASGRDDEATALQQIYQIEDKLGTEEELRAKYAQLVAQGRADEAAVVKDILDQMPALKQGLVEQARNERLVTEELRARQDILNAYLGTTQSIRQELTGIFSGTGSIKNLPQIFRNLQAQVTVEKLFGKPFRDLDNWVKDQSGLGEGVDAFVGETNRAGAALGDFTAALHGAITGVSTKGLDPADPLAKAFDAAFSAAPKAVNDNGAGSFANEIVVTATKPAKADGQTVGTLSPDEYQKRLKQAFEDSIGKLGNSLGVDLGGALGKELAAALTGYTTGGGSLGAGLGFLSAVPGLGGQSGVFGRALGGLQKGQNVSALFNAVGIPINGTGSGIGGALASAFNLGPQGQLTASIIGGSAGNNLASGIGAAAGAALGSIIPGVGTVLGSTIGSVLGTLVGGLFGSRPRGASEVSNTGNNAHTNNSDLTASLGDWGGQVQSAIQQIADALGVSVGNYSIGLGRYKEYYQVSTQAGDPRLGNSYFQNKSQYAVYDGTDPQAAMAAAINAALTKGAIQGISQASQNILKKGGSDLQAAIEKVVLIEGIPKKLKELTDPVGAAVDDLNTQFAKVVAALKEGGATASQYADAKKLYDLQRAAAIQQASEQITGSLKSLYDSQTVGNDALSLRDRLSAAHASYDPLAARVAAGDTTAYSDYASAAQTILDIQRQISGSQSGYFDLLNQVETLTKGQLDSQQALLDATNASASPFAGTPVGNANDNQGVIDGLGDLGSKLDAVNQNLGLLIQQGGISRPGLIDYYRSVANF